MVWRIVAPALLVAAANSAAGAQVPPRTPDVPAGSDARATEPGAGRAFALSAALPGAGQRQLGLDRWVGYAAIEALGWLHYLDRRGDGRGLERRYRDLAWEVARRGSVGQRRDGDFEYYEALARYRESGAYDADPNRAGVQPERAEETYNGSVWALARAIYYPADTVTLPDTAPERRLALDYYQAHAVGPEFAWSWGVGGTAQQSYRDLMRDSDEALRSATRTLGLILANHLVSAVDALVSARLRGPRNASPIKLECDVYVRGGRTTWSAVVRIPWPRN